jgi:uncharacterized protein (TIGR03083 family)
VTTYDGAAQVREAYQGIAAVLGTVDEDDSWAPTGCRGWSVRDLTLHLVGDAQRALVAMHTPTDDPADRDATSYWRDWAPDPVGAAQGRRHIRVGASMFLHWSDLRELHAETTAAVLEAATVVDAARRVRTQGHVLRTDDLLRTLALEAVVHHLDLVEHLESRPGPAAAGLAATRSVLEELLGAGPPGSWPDEAFVRVATGRSVPDTVRLTELGELADRLPVFS